MSILRLSQGANHHQLLTKSIDALATSKGKDFWNLTAVFIQLVHSRRLAASRMKSRLVTAFQRHWRVEELARGLRGRCEPGASHRSALQWTPNSVQCLTTGSAAGTRCLNRCGARATGRSPAPNSVPARPRSSALGAMARC